GARAAGPNRIIALAQGGEQVRHRLERTNDVFARAEKEAEPEARDQKRQRPLHFRRVIAEPKENKCDEESRRRRGQCEPAQSAFMCNPMTQFFDGFHARLFLPGSARDSRVRCGDSPPQRSRKRLARSPTAAREVACAPQLESILLESPIKRAPAQPQRFRGLARVAVETGKRLLDQKRFHFLEAHVLEPRRVVSSTRSAKIVRLHLLALRH